MPAIVFLFAGTPRSYNALRVIPGLDPNPAASLHY
jgi:hypothetical protein